MKERYTPKSKLLIYTYAPFYGYYYLSFRDVTLKEGDEEEFINALREFKNFYKEKGEQPSTYARDALYYLMKNSNLDWNKIWNNFSIQEFNGCLKELMDNLLRYINWETFTKKVDRSDNLPLVHRYYVRYCQIHGINKNIRINAFTEYVHKSLKRTKKTPGTAICEMLNKQYYDMFHRGYYPDSADDAIQRSWFSVLYILIDEAYIDEKVKFNGKKVSLKNVLLYQMLHEERFSYKSSISPEYDLSTSQKNVINSVFDNSSSLVFSGNPLNSDFEEYDRATINVMMENIDKTFDIFEDKNYQLYSPTQLRTLSKTGMYETENKPFIDRFARIVRFLVLEDSEQYKQGGCLRNKFLNFIYSDKIEVISYETLMSLKLFLNEEEFTNYVNYIVNSGIPIYFGNNLTITDTDEKGNKIAPENNNSNNAYQCNMLVTGIIENTQEKELSVNDQILINKLLKENSNSIYAYPRSNRVIRTLENAEEADLSVTEQMMLSKIKEELSKYKSSSKIFTK